MNVIRRKTLKAFWEAHPGLNAEQPLLDWFKICRRAAWKNLMETRATFRHADPVEVRSGRTVTVFNVRGNKIRVIALIDYKRQTMLVTHVLTHEQYDTNQWKAQL